MRINNFNKLLLSFFFFSAFFVSNLQSQINGDDFVFESYPDVQIIGNITPKVGDVVTYFLYSKRVAKMRVGRTATGRVAAKKPIRGLRNMKF